MDTPLRRWMTENGMTIEKLAQESGISARTVFSAREGAYLNSRTIEALRRVTGLPAADLMPPEPLSEATRRVPEQVESDPQDAS